MKVNDKEIEVLNGALDKLRTTTGLAAEVVEFEARGPRGDIYHDATIEIRWEDLRFRFAAEIKNVVNEAILAGIVHQMELVGQKGLLVAKYINPRIAERMHGMNIPFIDTAGNAYINEPPLYIFVKGNRPVARLTVDQPNRLYNPGGLQVIFTLLCNQGLENEPYREIAQKARVALGTVGWVMYDLKNYDYIVQRIGRERKLIRRNDLLKRWIEAYPQRLRPKNVLKRFRADDMNWWKDADLAEIKALWGGEVAANIMTDYLKPQTFTLYATPPIGKFVFRNRLKEEENGEIEILKRFWNFDQNDNLDNLVPPLLVYADLMATGNERNIETARIIYENEFHRYLGED